MYVKFSLRITLLQWSMLLTLDFALKPIESLGTLMYFIHLNTMNITPLTKQRWYKIAKLMQMELAWPWHSSTPSHSPPELDGRITSHTFTTPSEEVDANSASVSDTMIAVKHVTPFLCSSTCNTCLHCKKIGSNSDEIVKGLIKKDHYHSHLFLKDFILKLIILH